ncbi:hypothetical protein, partial [Clostridioides difficile]|uniref:hypothetical protein n=1 Tax=Clostridioides difficile TaxID=1496 RepID=UPI001A9C062D
STSVLIKKYNILDLLLKIKLLKYNINHVNNVFSLLYSIIVVMLTIVVLLRIVGLYKYMQR